MCLLINTGIYVKKKKKKKKQNKTKKKKKKKKKKKNTGIYVKNKQTDNSKTKLIPFNLFKPSGLFYLNSLDRSIICIRGVWLVFIIIMFCRHFWI